MSAWGTGNFENDGAMDYLDGLIVQLAATIKDVLADEDRFVLDGDAEFRVMPSVELIALLCERYNAMPPKVKTITQWRKKYLKLYDEQIDHLYPKANYKAERRKTIERTFAWLEGLAQSFWAK
jgi:hypothetical protein